MSRHNKIAWLYSYFEKDPTYVQNFRYFWNHVVSKNNDIDFFIIINGDHTLNRFFIDPLTTNIKVINRTNRGYDFGAYSHCVLREGLYIPNGRYTHFVFMNASVTGPFPCERDWRLELFALFDSGAPPVHLVGTTINIPNAWFNEHGRLKTHVQSMFFVLTNEAFQFLNQQYSFFMDEALLNSLHSKDYIIHEKEVRMTGLILHNGWNINCVLEKYKDIDYRSLHENINRPFEDPYYPNAYFGETIRPTDVIFFKTNRQLCPDLDLVLESEEETLYKIERNDIK